MFNVIDQYNSFVENNFIKKNKDQIEFLKQADNVWSSFSKTKLFFKDKIFEGIYLYGQVGTGKTFLLNLFYQNTKIGKKIHFNNLMNEIIFLNIKYLYYCRQIFIQIIYIKMVCREMTFCHLLI